MVPWEGQSKGALHAQMALHMKIQFATQHTTQYAHYALFVPQA
jgi:hypothetical protein